MKHKYKFTNKKNTVGGKFSTLFGSVSAVLIIYAIYISFQARGNAGDIVGILGTSSFICSTAGIIVGLSSFKEEDRFYYFSWFGTVVSAIVWIAIFAIIAVAV